MKFEFKDKPSCLDAAYERLSMYQGLVTKPAFPENIPIEKPHIADIVIEEMKKRKEFGIKKYGVPLQPYNGRSALQDAYEEALDLAQYLRQKIYEENGN